MALAKSQSAPPTPLKRADRLLLVIGLCLLLVVGTTGAAGEIGRSGGSEDEQQAQCGDQQQSIGAPQHNGRRTQ